MLFHVTCYDCVYQVKLLKIGTGSTTATRLNCLKPCRLSGVSVKSFSSTPHQVITVTVMNKSAGGCWIRNLCVILFIDVTPGNDSDCGE